ncbi:MAG: DUF1624 domain-containing protein [Holophagaceae bacterium]|nr:DUF1624 domain-containing protein [Holophagaceae bacterium]
MIVMIQVRVVGVCLHSRLRPDWLNYLNGLVAPSFTMAAGYSLVISTFRTDGTLRPFWPDTARRLGFILLCAYALHAPGITAADWTVLNTVQKTRELFKIDVLQCIVFSLLILQLLARLVRNPRVFTAWPWGSRSSCPGAPHMGAHGVADGLWLPIPASSTATPTAACRPLPAVPLDRLPGLQRLPGWPLPALPGGTRERPGPGGVNPGSWRAWPCWGSLLLAWGASRQQRPGSGAASGSRRMAPGCCTARPGPSPTPSSGPSPTPPCPAWPPARAGSSWAARSWVPSSWCGPAGRAPC